MLVLEADGEEDMLEAFEGGGMEEFGAEVEGEAAAVVLELLSQRVAIERGDETEEFFDLV